MSTYTPVASQTLSASASSVTFSNIPQGYTDLVLVISALGNVGNPTDYGIFIQINGDTAGNYSDTWLYGNGTSAVSSRRTNATSIQDIQGAGYLSTTSPNPCIINFINYSNSSTYKTILSRGNNPSGGGGTASVESCVGLWRSTSAITSIKVLTGAGSFGTNSTFSLYGIQAGTPKAQGGNIVTTDGTYWYHAFTASGTFTPSTAITADYLVVAGGGSGGRNRGGGGGAGGLRSTVTATGGGGSLESALSLSANTTYSVVIGAGGSGATTDTGSTSAGQSGSNSSVSGGSITAVTSTGGGYGGGQGVVTGGNGGSGGGGGGDSSTASSSGGTGTANQGYAGGTHTGVFGSYGSSGGGGGAGAVGTNAVTNTAGNGGAGVAISALATATNTGVSSYYAGGGGGSGQTTAGSGGSGGGGAGSQSGASSNNGTANTGSGGGGSYDTLSGNGGSGIVIVRYAV